MRQSGKQKRPFGISVIVMLSLFTTVVTLIDSGLFAWSIIESGAPWNVSENYYSYMLLLFVPLDLILIVGLWYLRRWAWLIFMLQLGFIMSVDLFLHFRGETPPEYFQMLMNVATVFYLNQRDVRRFFDLPAESGGQPMEGAVA